ncbi:MAG: hypothetical protein A3I29_04040 [Candidatus Magasanikbacteria bacterium RIFCSPLOWO2_02_FULL_44_11]|uniref:Glycosyltransferase RgtA/B/C/D-like domain-containing protein n=1 Tax=Candidatus Magasanikbacteria bacterium RIFCSPLOWO2_02_FULL_44_11 TaxID=1798689 RepID=A0A1F6N9I5_9BACT|nr:MAG: hypothetical protein A3I29_04040 [Candidatus Magasanikbacteria bacterium RIFCSPLOWO2_02_FULL_44_11]
MFREKIQRLWKSKKLLLIVLAISNLLVFYWLYGFHPNNDTDSFILTIKFFRGLDTPYVDPIRYLNPFYPLLAGKVLYFLSPAQALISLNIVFYFIIIVTTFSLILRVYKNQTIAFIATLLVIPHYALIRYALTQVQDMGGYFWFVLTLYAVWRWWERKQSPWLYLGSIAVAFGMLTKESGSMGALFAGMLFLFDKVPAKEKVVYFTKFSIFPLLVLFVNQMRGHDLQFNSFDLLKYSWTYYGAENYTFIRWLGVNTTTYNVIWVAFFIGLYYFIKNFKQLSREIKLFQLAIIPSSLTYFIWPVFIARTVVISAWFILPMAAYGLYAICQRYPRAHSAAVGYVLVAICTPYLLQGALGYVHVFSIIDNCHIKPSCIWQTFYKKRMTL